MKKILFILTFVLCSGTIFSQLAAFPGAEGFGMYATGGRGGTVIEVTNLNDAGTGSLRAAVEASGARTVVFRVSGTIVLSSRLQINNDNITIAGQTAPGEGICISNYPLSVSANNVIIRYIRSRLGDLALTEDDAMSGRNRQNIIIDHCSMSWSVDETGSFYDNTNFTLQYCILSESLYKSVHDKGNHGYGGIWGGKGASFHHNLLAHHTSRNPRFCGSRYSNQESLEKVDFRNNVIFNWGGNSGYAGEGGDYNLINNYYKSGPATGSTVKDRIFSPNPDDGSNAQAAGVWGLFYVEGNYVHGFPAVTEDNWLGMDPNPSTKSKDELKAGWEIDVTPVTTHSALEAFEHVMAVGGASLPKRDAVDARIIKETLTGKPTFGDSYGAGKGIIDTQSSVGGWPTLNSTTAPADTDHDGMPDDWEDANSLNKNDASDRNTVGAGGYTNLEIYLNGLVEDFEYILRPINFKTDTIVEKEVTLTWEDISDNETAFVLERYDTGTGWQEITTTNADDTSFVDNTITEYGDYAYRIKAVNSDTSSFYSDSLFVKVSLISGVGDNKSEKSKLSVFPNPAQDRLFLQILNTGDSFVVGSILDITGKTVMNLPVNLNENNVEVNIGNIDEGAYFLLIQTEKTVFSEKLVIQR